VRSSSRWLQIRLLDEVNGCIRISLESLLNEMETMPLMCSGFKSVFNFLL
jgi:hypothetical protein